MCIQHGQKVVEVIAIGVLNEVAQTEPFQTRTGDVGVLEAVNRQPLVLAMHPRRPG